MFQRNKTVIILGSVVGILIVLVIILLLVLASNNKQSNNTQDSDNTNINESDENTNTQSQDTSSEEELVWRLGANGYEAMGIAPACDDPLEVELPVEIENVTSILYPGQPRGGNYKPHGGFRFDNNSSNDVDVTAPMDGYVVTGARYIAEGEIQYTFDFIHPCGIMYRLGHIRELAPKFQAFAEAFPAATEDSRTTSINPPVWVEYGELIGTKVGIIEAGNVFLDYGVYDLRTRNESAEDATYAATYNGQLALNAICWLDYLGDSSEDIKSLPAGDPGSGKNSDYCK